MTESDIQQWIQIEGPKYHCMLMRNNSGAYIAADGRQVRYGLGNVSKKNNTNIKSSDLIGFTTVVITPDMVGKTVAVFTAIEVKAPDWKRSLNDKREKAQEAFINWIRTSGGIAGFANSIEGFKAILTRGNS